MMTATRARARCAPYTASTANAIADPMSVAWRDSAHRVAILMIASRDAFEIGDVLICHQGDEDHPREPGAFELQPPLTD
jgi:hypothetical protein